VLADQGRYMDAVNEFDRALQADPSYVTALEGSAQTREKLDNWTPPRIFGTGHETPWRREAAPSRRSRQWRIALTCRRSNCPDQTTG
jgi:hypothetical protein